MVGYQSLKAENRKVSKGIMGGWALEIGLASALLILPMLVLTAVLLALIYGHQMPNHNSTYSYNNETQLPLGTAYYVNYSATTLVYIASLSSTLATLLISAAMMLFSYSLARGMAQRSDANDAAGLPSPFQLQLLIRMVDGRLTALWSYLLYVLSGKRRKVAVVPVLWQAVSMMLALVMLAGLITLADLWLHLSTESIQYLETRPQAAPDWFNPGRGVNRSCLDSGNTLDESTYVAGCVIIPGDAVNSPVLRNQTEFVKTAANMSDINKVYLGVHNKLQYSVLGPAQIPDNLDFEATSYGSHTECRMVTAECGAITAYGDRDEPPSVFNFVCNNTVAGLNMTGNFANLGQKDESYQLSYTNASSMLPANTSRGLIIENVNTMSESNYGFGFQYYNDSAKREQVSYPSAYGLGGTEYTPITSTTDQYFWAFAFSSSMQLDISDAVKDRNPWSGLNLVASAQGGAEGIMSCVTNISEIKYTMSQSTLTILSTSPPRPNASIPFINAITGSWGDDQLYQGLQQSTIRATSASDLASLFATVYDQTLVALPAGVLNSLPVLNATQRIQTQVARVPIAPFVCLLLLNCVFAAVGVVLTVTALVARATGNGVRDAQARLGVAAVVAEGFEPRELGEDATGVDMLFAERRGRVTRRVALGLQGGKGGGGGFGRLVVMVVGGRVGS